MKRRCLVLGMGATGLSLARHFARRGCEVAAADTRERPPALAAFARELPQARCFVGENFYNWRPRQYADFDVVGVSPGVDETRLAAPPAKQTNDAKIFSALWRRNSPPAKLFAVTGSNGKSTTVALARHILSAGGMRAESVGNIGMPLLDAWGKWRAGGFPAAVAAELSSFHLALATNFYSDAAAVVNIAADHLDRHGSLQNYARIKRRIYRRARWRAANEDDALARPRRGGKAPRVGFSVLGAPANWRLAGGRVVGNGMAFSVRAMSPACKAQLPTVLAALALTQAAALPRRALAVALANFAGLPHRQEFVCARAGVSYINDSKATNVAATLFALNNINGKVVLVAGGDGKGQGFAPLQAAAGKIAFAALIGKDAPALQRALAAGGVATARAPSLAAAFALARRAARAGQTVLLSPACSSLDMFANYEERGRLFCQLARAVGKRRAG